MKKTLLALAGVAFTMASNLAASADRFDFACSDVKELVRLIEKGPTEALNEAGDDPVAYRDRSIRGWTCLVTPLPPLRDGRPYLQSFDCYADNGSSNVTEQSLSAAGTQFQKNLASFNACFGRDLLTEAPVSYAQNHRGEGIRAVLSDSYGGHHIIVQYGYLWDQVQTGRIVWQSIVAYGESGEGSRIGNNTGGHLDYRSCSSQCKEVKNQCYDACGPGPDHVNNPGWLRCRESCRSDNSSCRSDCSSADSSVANGEDESE